MNVPFHSPVANRDLDSREEIARFVDAFYARLLEDEVLAPIFLDVAAVDLAVHLPHIRDYWAKLLLGDTAYRRHTMNIHRHLHGKRALTAADFERWLAYFTAAVDDSWKGPGAERAKRVATAIAGNMTESLHASD
jgi:hemoglobin